MTEKRKPGRPKERKPGVRYRNSSFELELDQWRWLGEVAYSQGKSKSAVVREMIDAARNHGGDDVHRG